MSKQDDYSAERSTAGHSVADARAGISGLVALGPPAERFGDGARASLAVLLGYVAVGVAFGVVARTAGLSVPEVALMSLILYAGSAQFVTAGLLGAGAAASAIIVTVFLVNIRHLLYSAALAPHVRRLPSWQSALIGAQLTDETFTVAAGHLTRQAPADDGPAAQVGSHAGRARWLFGLNLTAHATWIAATVTGALLGSAIPDTRVLGLDFALAAMFAALLVLQMASRPAVYPAVGAAGVGAVVAVGGALIIPASWAIIAATIIAASVGLALEQAVARPRPSSVAAGQAPTSDAAEVS